MTYRPAPQTQITGGAYQKVNCTKASTTMAMDRHSVGRYRTGPDRLRAISLDTSGGESYEECRAAASKASGGKVVLEPRYSQTRSNVRDYSAGGRGMVIGIEMGVTRLTTRRTCSTCVGHHSIYVNDYHWIPASSTPCTCEKATTTAHGEFDVCDPGHSLTYLKFQRWSAALLYHAAEVHGNGGAGDSVIALMLTHDTEGVTRTSVESGQLFASPSTTATVVASFPAGKSFTVVATATGGGIVEPDSKTRKGWHKVKNGTGYAWAKGRSLQ